MLFAFEAPSPINSLKLDPNTVAGKPPAKQPPWLFKKRSAAVADPLPKAGKLPLFGAPLIRLIEPDLKLPLLSIESTIG